jgi:site-specific DNA recombinase
MLGVFAEFEREVIIDRVIAGMDRKAATGICNSPAGFAGELHMEWLRPTAGVPRRQGQPATRHRRRRVHHRPAHLRLLHSGRLGTQAVAALLNNRGLRTRMCKPWSQHTVEHILTNRVYVGEKRFRDIVIPNAHPPITTTDQFDLAQRILGERSADISQRASNPSDFTLTGKIRCPQCGRGYVGTAAHGRYSRYRYYVCWSRVRYGTKAGCDIHRYNANELEAAIGQALLDFYTTGHDVIAEATARFQAAHATTTSSNAEQLATVRRKLPARCAGGDSASPQPVRDAGGAGRRDGG